MTGFIGGVAGALLWFTFQTAARRTHMPVASATIAIILGAAVLAGIGTLRYRIQERPFEPPVWIEPGLVSLYLPAVAIIVGAMLAARFNRQVAAR